DAVDAALAGRFSELYGPNEFVCIQSIRPPSCCVKQDVSADKMYAVADEALETDLHRDGRSLSDDGVDLHLICVSFHIGEPHARPEAEGTDFLTGGRISFLHGFFDIRDPRTGVSEHHGDLRIRDGHGD